VLFEFPSVVDAVECAVAVQAVMAERNQGVPEDRLMLFRVGSRPRRCTPSVRLLLALPQPILLSRCEAAAR
jgi:hypothetical protein